MQNIKSSALLFMENFFFFYGNTVEKRHSDGCRKDGCRVGLWAIQEALIVVQCVTSLTCCILPAQICVDSIETFGAS
jgi:hypothetical protein